MNPKPLPLSPDHDTSSFDSGSPVLDDWLRRRGRSNEGRFSRTYVIVDDNKVVAFVSTAVGAVERRAAPAILRRNGPDLIPVAILGRLAVDQAYVGQGLGSDLLLEGLRRIALASEHVGIAAVIVHAKNDAALRFYLKRIEFTEYPDESRTLYLPIETLLASVPGPRA